MSRRIEKVSALLHQEVGEYLLRLELPALTTISKVDVTPDMKYCKVWVTILGPAGKQQQTLKILKAALPEMQKEINHKFTMKIVPRISFVLDHAEEYASHINELLKKTQDE